MNELSKVDTGSLITHKYKKSKELADLKPFQRDILLFDTYVAGTSHVEGIEELEPFITIGDRLDFFRDADNAHDNNAIEVRNKNHVKIGFVPQKDNIVFARLMDAGKLLYGKVTSKELQGRWVKIDMEIYLHEI